MNFRRNEKQIREIGAGSKYVLSSFVQNSNVPVGRSTPCTTTRIPTGARRVPARVRTRARSRSSPTPLVTTTAPCARLPTTSATAASWASIWVIRTGGRGSPRWSWTGRLHAHLGRDVSPIDTRHIRSRLNGKNQVGEFCLQLTKSLHAGCIRFSWVHSLRLGGARTLRTTSCGLTLPTVSTSK